jgi:hypothetical protein
MSDKILCASGGECDGICREKHLKRKRLAGTKHEFNKCPAAYTETKGRTRT